MKYRLLAFFIALFVFVPFCSQNQQNQNISVMENEEEWMPEIAPYLVSNPSSQDGQGHISVNPMGPFISGSSVDFTITYTVGKSGIAPKGFILLQISPWWGWSVPQSQNSSADGFITVKTSFKDPTLKVKILPMNRVVVYSKENSITQGETIIFHYNCAGVDNFAESEKSFRIFVDADADGHSGCVTPSPEIKIIARKSSSLVVSMPSQTNPGDRIRINAAPIDTLGNWGIFPKGKYNLLVNYNGKNSYVKSKYIDDLETLISFEYVLSQEGIYFFSIEGPEGITGKSNVSLCQGGIPRLKLYFGDIHGHSRLSDGTGTPDDYYRYVRYVSGLSIAALTDHVDYGLIPITGTVWEEVKNAANSNYLPGEFVTFVAYEWTNWIYGHRNVYFRKNDGPVFRSIDNISDTPQKLWQQLSTYEAMTIAHHVGGGPVPVDWTIPPGPVESLVEICSIHGSSEYYGCEKGIYRPMEGHFVRDALLLGYKLGIIGSGDTHDGHPGQRSVNAAVNGIMGVYSSELTRESVWDALKKRRVYGTTGPKIILNFRVGDSPMGSEINWSKSKGPIPILLRAICCDEIQLIEIIRNGITIFRENGEKINGVAAMFLIEDSEPLQGISWYYLRVIQKDGNMAWSSPVWISNDLE